MAGRTTVRPFASFNVSPGECNIGQAVDAWWNDGWWEGIIINKEPPGDFQVYFPGIQLIVFSSRERGRFTITSSVFWNGLYVALPTLISSLALCIVLRVLQCSTSGSSGNIYCIACEEFANFLMC